LKEFRRKRSIRGIRRRSAAEEERNYKGMKKFLGEIILKVVLKERCFIERVKEQYKNNKRKKLPPKPVGLRPVLNRRLAAKQKTFRNKKDPAGFGRFPG
jgi:hypothetical protein